MFWWKNLNKIKRESGVCPPLCRDPQKLLMAKKNSGDITKCPVWV
jgi:hypothetical protein